MVYYTGEYFIASAARGLAFFENTNAEITSIPKVETVISTKPVECKRARVGQNLLADTADMADTQFVGKTDSAHVCQKHLADMAELADMAD